MYPWVDWCYGNPSVLLYNHSDVILSSCGVQQGDPLGPLLFSVALSPVVEEIQALSPHLNLWYLDDGVIVGPPDLLQQAWDIIRSRGPGLGLHPNASKCEWIWLGSSRAPCPLYSGPSPSAIPVTPLDDLSILGVPLGPPDIVSAFISKKLFDNLCPLYEKLVAFEDTQSASFLLRVSFSSVRATHFMRTTPLSHWHSVASSFDSSVRRTFESIVGFPLSPQAYTQACLTPKLGGFGLRQVVAHAEGAFKASCFEVFSAWGSRLGWSSSPSPCPSQQEASFTLDSSILSGLVASFSSPRERQRLNRVSQPHAGSWVTAVPSSLDGPDAIIRPVAFRVACRLRLGVPVCHVGAPCPCCMHTLLDAYGDHAICCTTTGDLIVRHNRIRDLVDKIAREGHLSPILEKKGILGESYAPSW